MTACQGPSPVTARGRFRGSIGDNSILGDTRWGGLYGVDADFVAAENCKVCCVGSEDVQVRLHPAAEPAESRFRHAQIPARCAPRLCPDALTLGAALPVGARAAGAALGGARTSPSHSHPSHHGNLAQFGRSGLGRRKSKRNLRTCRIRKLRIYRAGGRTCQREGGRSGLGRGRGEEPRSNDRATRSAARRGPCAGGHDS